MVERVRKRRGVEGLIRLCCTRENEALCTLPVEE